MDSPQFSVSRLPIANRSQTLTLIKIQNANIKYRNTSNIINFFLFFNRINNPFVFSGYLRWFLLLAIFQFLKFYVWINFQKCFFCNLCVLLGFKNTILNLLTNVIYTNDIKAYYDLFIFCVFLYQKQPHKRSLQEKCSSFILDSNFWRLRL